MDGDREDRVRSVGVEGVKLQGQGQG